MCDRLARETEWFMENAALADMVAEPQLTVKYLLELADNKGLHFRNTVTVATAWICEHYARRPRKRVGYFYVKWFDRALPAPPKQFKPEPVAAPVSLTSWVKGIPGV